MYKGINLEQIINRINYFINISDNLSDDEFGFEIDQIKNCIIENFGQIEKEEKKESYINSKLKKKNKILCFFDERLKVTKNKYKDDSAFSEKHPILNAIHKRVNTEINELKNEYGDDFINNRYENFNSLRDFIIREHDREVANENYNPRKLEILRYILGVLFIVVGDTENSNKQFAASKNYHFEYKVQKFFNRENLKKFLENSETTKKDIEEKILLIHDEFKNHSEFKDNAFLDFRTGLLREQMNNLYIIKAKQETILKEYNEKLKTRELSVEEKNELEKNYNIYANILHLEGFTFSNRENNENEYGKARDIFDIEDSCREVSFYLNEGKILGFICENCLDPRILQEKIENLIYFRENLISRDNLFNIIYKNLNNIEESLKTLETENKNFLAGLNFFKAKIIEKLVGVGKNFEYNREYFDCIEKAEKYYYEIDTDESKIAYLTVINDLQNTFNNSNTKNNKKNFFTKIFNKILNIEEDNQLTIEEEKNANKIYKYLSKLNKEDNKELYAKAQYECGLYNKKKSYSHFKDAISNGNIMAKIKTIEYLIKNKKINKKEKDDKIKLLELDIPEKYSKILAELYEKNNDYKKSIEFYKKASNYTNSIIESKAIFTKIGDYYVKIGDKIKKNLSKKESNKEELEQQSKDYYEKAKDYYKKAFMIDGKIDFDSYEITSKLIHICKELNDIENYKYYLNIQKYSLDNLIRNEQIKEKKDFEKKYIKEILYELALYNKNLNIGESLKYFNKAAELGDENSIYELGCHYVRLDKEKAKEYFRKAINFGHQNSIIEYTNLLVNEEKSQKIENEIYNLTKKIKNSEDKFKIANKIRLKYKEKAFKLFKELEKSGNIKAKFEVAIRLRSGIGTKKNEKLAIKYFKDLSKNNIDKNIKIDSLIALGNISSEKNDLKYALEYYLSAKNISLQINNNSDQQIINEKLNDINKKIYDKQILKYNKAKYLININEKKSIKIFKELSKDNKNQNIKIESFTVLGDIYAEHYKEKDLNLAEKYYMSILEIYTEDTNKFEEINIKMIGLYAKKNILNFNKKTKDSDIKNTVRNMLDYLRIVDLDQKEKEIKFSKFIKVLNSKLSKYKKKLELEKMEKINKEFNINENEILIVNIK